MRALAATSARNSVRAHVCEGCEGRRGLCLSGFLSGWLARLVGPPGPLDHWIAAELAARTAGIRVSRMGRRTDAETARQAGDGQKAKADGTAQRQGPPVPSLREQQLPPAVSTSSLDPGFRAPSQVICSVGWHELQQRLAPAPRVSIMRTAACMAFTLYLHLPCRIACGSC